MSGVVREVCAAERGDGDPLFRLGHVTRPPLTVERALGERGRRPSFVWCFLAFVPANMFSGHASDGVLPVGPDRILLGAGVLLLLFDERAALWSLKVRPVHIVASLAVAWATLSAFAFGTLTESAGFFALLDRMVVPVLIFAIAPTVFARSEDRKALLKVLTLMGLYLGLTALAEVAGAWSLVFPTYIADPLVGIHYGRARGPFAAAEANGLVLIAAGFSALALSMLERRRPWQWVSRASALIAFVGSTLTLTRSVWVGLLVALLMGALIEPAVRRKVALILGVGVACLVIFLMSSAAGQDLFTDRAQEQRSVYDRAGTNAAAWRIVLSHPLTGVGWARFDDVGWEFARQGADTPLNRTDIEVHNVVLARGAELGLPGMILWTGSIVIGPVAVLIRRRRSQEDRLWRLVATGTVASWLVAVMLSPVSYPLPNSLVWLLTGILARDYLRRPPDPRVRTG